MVLEEQLRQTISCADERRSELTAQLVDMESPSEYVLTAIAECDKTILQATAQLEVIEAMAQLERIGNPSGAPDAELRTKVRAMQIERRELTAQVEKLLRENEELRRDASDSALKPKSAEEKEFEKKLDEVRRDLYAAEKELRNLRDDYDTVNLERRQFETRVQELETRNQTLKSQLEKLHKAQIELDELRNTSQERLGEFSDKCDRLALAKRQADTQNQVLKRRNSELQTRCHDLEVGWREGHQDPSPIPQVAVCASEDRFVISDVRRLDYAMWSTVGADAADGYVVVRGVLDDLKGWKVLLKSETNISRPLRMYFMDAVESVQGNVRYFRSYKEPLAEGDIIFLCPADVWEADVLEEGGS